MISLEKLIEELSDAQLERCFIEIYKLRTEGELPKDSLLREVWERYKSQSGDTNFPLHAVPVEIMYEICKRKYRDEGIYV